LTGRPRQTPEAAEELADTSQTIEPSLVCILGWGETPVGAGCLLTERLVVTCAHVIAAAIRCDEYATEPPKAPTLLQFAYDERRENYEAIVEAWWAVSRDGSEPLDGRADLALLRLSKPPPRWAKPARLAETDNIRYQKFEALGFPAGHPLGLPTNGVCGLRRRDRRIVVQSQSFPFDPGFSGSPVWIEAYGAVGGILVERVIDKRMTNTSLAAFVIPASLLRAFVGSVAGPIEETSIGQLLWVPDLPTGYIARTELIAEIKTKLLAPSAAVAVSGEGKIGGLGGMGGIGKTVLASAVVHDEEMRRAFPDGIYWLTLGQQGDALAQQIQLAHEISKQPEGFTDVQTGTARPQELFRTRRSMIVLDDVWSVPDARAFQLENTTTRLFLTTRNSRVMEALNATEIQVPKLSADLALNMLASFSGQPREALPAEAVGVVQQADGLPLAIAMAGRLVYDKPKAWPALLKRLKEVRVAAPIGKESEFPYESVARAIEASIEALTPQTQELFLDLAIFPEDVPIPLWILESFWRSRGLDSLAVFEQVEDFVARSIASWDEEGQNEARRDRLVLHDLLGAYLRRRVTEPEARHEIFLAATRPTSQRWADLPPDEAYLWSWLSFHLVKAGRQKELESLLLDPVWIAAKLSATNMPALLADYDRYAVGEPQKVIGRTLRLIAGICARDRRQLIPQLLGRLMTNGIVVASGFLNAARQLLRPPAILERHPSLTPPGAETARLEGHSGEITALCVLPDGRLASGSRDKTIRLWDVTRGAETARLEGHSYSVLALCMLPDGRLPRALRTRRSGCGMWYAAPRSPAWKGTPMRSLRYACCPTAASPRALMTAQSGCGTWRAAPRPRAWKGTRVLMRCACWPTAASPRALRTRRSGCGTWRAAPRRPAWKGAPVGSPRCACCPMGASPRALMKARSGLKMNSKTEWRAGQAEKIPN
jgi:hypothetical protein